MTSTKSIGLEKAVEESKAFDKIVCATYSQLAKEIYGTEETPDLAVFAYGSPGRYEMVGGDSDADVFLVEGKRTPQSERFKKELEKRLSPFHFSKIDMPEWGTLDEARTYLEKSLILLPTP